MVFDWDRAAWLIREFKATHATAGLAGNWECTSGPILEDGKPVDPEFTSFWLASDWAEPHLVLEGEMIPCWRLAYHAPGWDESTYWPKSALAILEGDKPPEDRAAP
jgi:hypothetical protein